MSLPTRQGQATIWVRQEIVLRPHPQQGLRPHLVSRPVVPCKLSLALRERLQQQIVTVRKVDLFDYTGQRVDEKDHKGDVGPPYACDP